MSYKELPNNPKSSKLNVLQLNLEDENLVNSYFQLIWQESQRKNLNIEVIDSLQSALILRVEELYRNQINLENSKQKNRKQEIFYTFISLVRKYGIEGRSVEFYADKIFVTPNYLGNVIKEVSNSTVKQWIDRNLILQAKISLRYSLKAINEISDELNFSNPSFFSKFFKKETGMTPQEYRKIDRKQNPY